MPDVEFMGPSRQNADHVQADTSRLVNLFREPVGSGGRTSHILRTVLSTTALRTLGELFIRDMRVIGDTLYVLNGTKLRSISQAGVLNTLGAITSANGGHIFGESGAVGIVSGGRYQVWTGSALVEPAVTPFTPTTGNIGSGAFLSGYTILTEKNGRTFAWSDLLDAQTFPGTSIATVESTEDAILRVIAVNGRLVFFKENSMEVWYLTGQAGANAFARLSVSNTGLKAADLVTTLRDVLFWVGSDGVVYLSDGQAQQPVSSAAVERNIRAAQVDRCFAYEQDGHKLFAIRYRDRPADVFNLSTAEWLERASGALQGAWSSRCSAYFNSTWHTGADTGEIFTLVAGSADADGPLIGECTSSTLKFGNSLFRIAELEVYADMAPLDQSNIPGDETITALFIDTVPDPILVGSESVDADDFFDVTVNEDRHPSIEMAISGDYGHTWAPFRTESLGRVGEYDNRALWRQLGQFRQATIKLRVSDNVARALNSRATLRVQQ